MKAAYCLVIFAVSILVTNAATGTNLIANGDFEQGVTGFNTGYDYNSTAFPEGKYAITTNPKNNHPFYADYHDHTTSTGNMMIANGATSPDVIVWVQTVSILPDTNYEFSFWLSTANEALSDINPADLEYFINDASLGIISPPEQYGVWIQESKFWYSGAYTSVTIRIVDTDTNWWGNDFALDDISFETVPEPASATMIALGAALFASRRKRR